MVWQSRPVFISSTFSDMQAERDHLRTHVFPALEERLKARRRHLEWVDLRLGVATAGEADVAARELQVLKVCLSEVKRCRPFLIVLLGDRYGWVPPADRIAAAAAEEAFGAGERGRSVTDMEVRYGVLADPEQHPRSYFYFRQPLPYGDMPLKVAALYSDAHGSGPGAADRAKRLAELKHEIETTLPTRVRRYTAGWDSERQRVSALEAWGRSVLEDVWSDLEAATTSGETEEQASWLQVERTALDDYVEDRARDFVGRSSILARMATLAYSPTQHEATWGVCLTGNPGTGKSAIFGEFYRHLKHSDAFLLAHAAGASARSASVEDMLRRWVEELGAALVTDAALPDNADPDTIETTFQSLLVRMAARRRVVVLIDALDQFEATTRARFVTWLPRTWPANARLIATAIPGEASKALEGRSGVEILALPPLDAAEARRIAESICARYHRTLEPEVLNALLTKPGAAAPAWGNPLWLVLAVEELNLVDADDFARAKRAYKGVPAEQLRALMLDVVAALPSDVINLYQATFDRAEELYGGYLARAFLGLIALGRGGWRESDFRVLLPRLSRPLKETRSGLMGRLFRRTSPRSASAGEGWDELRFASLRRVFRGQIRQRGSLGQWDFNHAQMRVATRQRLAAQDISEAAFHTEVAEHLLALTRDDPLRQSETMVHLLGAENRTRAASFYGDASLTEEEIDGATRILADGLLKVGASHETAGLAHVLRLLDAPVPTKVTATVVDRVWFELRPRLEGRATLQARDELNRAFGHACERLAAADPSNADSQRMLLASRAAAGDVLIAQGNLAEALKCFRDVLAGTQRLAVSDPGNLDAQRELAASHARIGDLLQAQGNLSEALTSYRTSNAILDLLVKADPSDVLWRHDLSLSQAKIGELLEAQGNLSEALASYRASHDINERLASDDPTKTDWQHSLSLSQMRIGRALHAQGKFDEARASYGAAQRILERLAATDPTNSSWQRDLLVSQDSIADVLRAQGSISEALSTYRASNATFERLAKADPSNTAWPRDLAKSHTRVGDVLQAQGNVGEALACYREALTVRGRLANNDPSNAEWQRDQSLAHNKMGDLLQAQGNLSEALTSYRASLAIRERLAADDPSHAGWQRDIAVSNERIGNILNRQGQKQGASEALERALSIHQRLLARDPGDIQTELMSVSTLMQIGVVKGRDGCRELKEALTILKRHEATNRLEAYRRSWIAQVEALLASFDQ